MKSITQSVHRRFPNYIIKHLEDTDFKIITRVKIRKRVWKFQANT